MKNIFAGKKRKRFGFTLIELLVAMFIFSVILVGMVAIFISTTRAYTKSRAIKSVSENVQFALNSIAKDIRMGKVEVLSWGSGSYTLSIIRRAGMRRICYRFNITENKLQYADVNTASTYTCDDGIYDDSSFNPKTLIDLAGTGMAIGENSKFYALMTDETPGAEQRGVVEINFEITPDTSSTLGMETDAIQIQTTVSTRDYGWELP